MSHPPSDDPQNTLMSWGELVGPVEHNVENMRYNGKWDDHCNGTITREDEEDACGKTPVSALTSWDEWNGGWHTWAVCAYHAHMYGGRDGVHPVPLSVLLDSNRTEV